MALQPAAANQMIASVSDAEAEALKTGGWEVVQDPSGGRPVFYHPATQRATRDLKRELLKGLDPVVTPKPGAAGSAQYIETAKARAEESEVDRLRRELEAARVLNSQYEHELTQLRHAMLSGGRGADLEKPLCRSAVHLAGSDSAALVLAQRVRSLEELNAKLYKQLVVDRQTQFVCRVCHERSVLEEARGDLNRNNLAMRAAQVMLTESLGKFGLRPDEVDSRTRQPNAIEAESTSEAAKRGAIPGYLPKNFASTNVTTSHKELTIPSETSALNSSLLALGIPDPNALNQRTVVTSSVDHDMRSSRIRFDMTPQLTVKSPSIMSGAKIDSDPSGPKSPLRFGSRPRVFPAPQLLK